MTDTRGTNHHNERMLKVVAHEAAIFIQREAGAGSLMTVIRAESMSHGTRIAVFVSVFPEEKARTALAFLERQREAFSNHLKTHARLGHLPRVDFLLDNRETANAPTI